jgi:hypothetical protein
MNVTDPFGLESLGEMIHGYSETAWGDEGAWWQKLGRRTVSVVGEVAYAATEVASVGSVGKIDAAQEALERGEISQGEYWKRTGVAVAQTGANYVGGLGAGAAGARVGIRLLGSRGVTAAGVRTVGAISGSSGAVGGQLATDLVGIAAGTQQGLSSLETYGTSLVVGGGLGATTALPRRLVRDVDVNPNPPRALSTERPIGRSRYQNRLAQERIAAVEQQGGGRVRVDQQQVNAAGQRVGINRPDIQYTDATGRRIYIEYDIAPATRAVPHARRLLANDPRATAYLFTTPRAGATISSH